MGIFAAMKGAFDGGLEIPHNDEKSYEADANRERLLGGHVAEYMNSLQEEEPEEFEEKFKKYIEAGITADNMEDTYLAVHKKIRETPEHVPTEKKKPADLQAEKRDGGIRYTNAEGKSCFINRRGRSLSQRKDRVKQKKDFVLNSLAEGDDDDEEEEDEE